MPAFKFESKRANFHISGEKLTIVANKTYLKTHGLNEQGEYQVSTTYYSYPEVSIVAKIVSQTGYEFSKNEVDGKEHYTFKNHGEINLELLQIFGAICILQDLLTLEEGKRFVTEFAEYQKDPANADKRPYFFAETSNAHPKNGEPCPAPVDVFGCA